MMRFDYLRPAIGEVINGLEDCENIYALEQGEYLPVRTLPAEEGNSAIYRLELTDQQRQMVSQGADVLVEILHFRGPLAPSRVMLVNQKGMTSEEIRRFAAWFCAQTRCPRKASTGELDDRL